jgi:1,4-dihydroxy-2-naphthoyl-CoA hydrolase
MSFSYARTVYLADTDAAGVVYFTNVMNMCHEAYEESLGDLKIYLKQSLANLSLAIPIVQAEISFFSPMFWGDKLLINLTPKQISENEFAIDYLITSASAEEKYLAKAYTRHVCINAQTRNRLQLPAIIIQWLTSYSQ